MATTNTLQIVSYSVERTETDFFSPDSIKFNTAYSFSLRLIQSPHRVPPRSQATFVGRKSLFSAEENSQM